LELFQKPPQHRAAGDDQLGAPGTDAGDLAPLLQILFRKAAE